MMVQTLNPKHAITYISPNLECANISMQSIFLEIDLNSALTQPTNMKYHYLALQYLNFINFLVEYYKNNLTGETIDESDFNDVIQGAYAHACEVIRNVPDFDVTQDAQMVQGFIHLCIERAFAFLAMNFKKVDSLEFKDIVDRIKNPSQFF